MSRTQISQLTPSGRSAVAVLSLQGDDAFQLVNARFQAKSGKPLEAGDTNRPIYGELDISGPGHESSHEQMLVHIESPKSIELHCHGGPVIVRRIIDTFVESGAESVHWSEMPSQENDLVRVESLYSLTDAKTSRTAALLMVQHNGAMSVAAKEVKAAIDRNDFDTALHQIDDLLRFSKLGLHLAKPWDVVLAGPPNAGKSSLINVISGFERAIVDHVPGTTRDLVTTDTVLDGWPIRLCDTAGLRDSNHAVERQGIDRANTRLIVADLVVLIFDASADWTDEQQQLTDSYPDAIIVHNKSDLLDDDIDANTPYLKVSAVTRDGVNRLMQSITQRLVPQTPDTGQPIPFTQRQIDILRRLREAISQKNSAEATKQLRAMFVV